MQDMQTFKRGQGLTLFELIIAVLLLSLIIGFAMPSLSNMLASSEYRVTRSTLINSLSEARNYALTHGVTVHICQLPSDKSKTECDGSTSSWRRWSDGWLLFADYNGNDRLDQEELLKVIRLDGKIGIVFNQRGKLRFSSNGGARSAGFYLCTLQKTDISHLTILHTGRVRLRNKADSRLTQRCLKKSAKNNAKK